MLRPCQHRFAFTKVNWYTSALKAIIPSSSDKSLHTSSLLKLQSRPTATMASVLSNDTIMPATRTFVIPPPPPPPLVKPLQQNDYYAKYFRSKRKPSQQCSGFTRLDGQRCKRMVRIDPSLPETDRVLCCDHDPTRVRKSKKKKTHRHSEKEVVAASHSYHHEHTNKALPKVFDCWHLWIGEHIEGEKRDLIRQEMEKPISSRDKPGFIYAYSLHQGPRVSRNTYAYFKVGRTTNPHRRMYQFNNTCKLEPKIVELFPSFPSNGKQKVLPTNLEILEKTLDELPKCPLSHRVERLIHLELSSSHKSAGYKCPECGSIHGEWIRVNRRKHPDGTRMTDQELWQSSVRPIILKWVQYGVVASALKG